MQMHPLLWDQELDPDYEERYYEIPRRKAREIREACRESEESGKEVQPQSNEKSKVDEHSEAGSLISEMVWSGPTSDVAPLRFKDIDLSDASKDN
ncbi:hypothetical protein N7481_009085 [Penicillium waksmanii]|uniref:uncharacterized protein n=1 Tax=Penicillium waksmanii TaxID=69791 RepID=UPI002547D25E|nr:uncharacterized protein N7481_009085 [Penicillium waksmanii]KAJ5975378.1 hypothetical protein N7481_009085 [Penicillium waksmanii]